MKQYIAFYEDGLHLIFNEAGLFDFQLIDLINKGVYFGSRNLIILEVYHTR